MSAIHAETAAQIYEWARLDGFRVTGEAMGEAIIKRQISGISVAVEAGIIVKVNTILIPGINEREIGEIARAISRAGADLQNIVPLVPAGNMMDRRPPSQAEIADARSIAAQYIPQFAYCMQCRSDVVGIPGNDRVL
jgi:nitrogen fixation protein NifB